ncbi:NAD dependent epimerase/dehydratase [Paenibacillus baekrokdamisoli]|uniref:NAD dependent epimerase/dehydratase n=1 Tax=Paenibacillus baekrokdamisoli TaxID=1712516 RepID=A0A3G9JIL4_9BACL|nr:NAD-dependent epimerase/dehydratase family protein [Paenibacillus baekrokdamisoli]MBB3068087.1 nucleoside-diphosphate-sugar epimerase [Paenibacillus baekrokdamisoli]BBH22869.1 NAD dependent epimerase/dehydratase [Paenibacillus baekrokdamisoli]
MQQKKKVLVLGGTRFFGKKLVERLIQEEADVTVITRGSLPESFGDAVKHLQADRTDSEALRRVLGVASFDLVYDNICYSPQNAQEAVKLFDGRVGTYIVTSSVSVYPFGEPRKVEADFDPYSYLIPEVTPEAVDYAEGKRLVETVLLQQASFPVVAVRFPIVLGHSDYTRRLHFHVEHVQQGLPLGIPSPDVQISFIEADEAADFLLWLGRSSLTGPVNACSEGEISPRRIVSLIEQATGKKSILVKEADAANQSPFGIPEPWYFDTTKARSAGFNFQQLNEWLPQLIIDIAGNQHVRESQ